MASDLKAAQLAHVKRITEQDLAQYVHKAKTPSVEEGIKFSDQISEFVKNKITEQRGDETKIKRWIKFFIQLTNQSVKEGDFESAAAIRKALSSEGVSSLKVKGQEKTIFTDVISTTGALGVFGTNYKNMWENLTKIFSPDSAGDYTNLHSEYSKFAIAYIPVLEPALTEMEKVSQLPSIIAVEKHEEISPYKLNAFKTLTSLYTSPTEHSTPSALKTDLFTQVKDTKIEKYTAEKQKLLNLANDLIEDIRRYLKEIKEKKLGKGVAISQAKAAFNKFKELATQNPFLEAKFGSVKAEFATALGIQEARVTPEAPKLSKEAQKEADKQITEIIGDKIREFANAFEPNAPQKLESNLFQHASIEQLQYYQEHYSSELNVYERGLAEALKPESITTKDFKVNLQGQVEARKQVVNQILDQLRKLHQQVSDIGEPAKVAPQVVITVESLLKKESDRWKPTILECDLQQREKLQNDLREKLSKFVSRKLSPAENQEKIRLKKISEIIPDLMIDELLVAEDIEQSIQAFTPVQRTEIFSRKNDRLERFINKELSDDEKKLAAKLNIIFNVAERLNKEYELDKLIRNLDQDMRKHCSTSDF